MSKAREDLNWTVVTEWNVFEMQNYLIDDHFIL